jgi:hypothetical protein
MAVVQISKIQVRRGLSNQTGIPQLSGGEFAWAIDAQELYIGNGAVSEGAPYVGNTQILTINDASNIFKLANTYTFEGNTGATVITGVDANNPIQRTLQSKLDDTITLTDFGAIGSGTDNDTKAMQRTLDQIYLNSADKSLKKSKRKVIFPAGEFLITGTIFVPPYATIEGAGKDKTVIIQSTAGLPIFQTCDLTSTPTNKVVFPAIQSITAPTQVSIKGLTVKFASNALETSEEGLINLDCATDAVIEDVKFLGRTTTAAGAGSWSSSIKGIKIRGQGATTSNRVKIENCNFENLSAGVYSNWDITNVRINNSTFITMGKGVSLAETLTVGDVSQRHGPVDVKITNSRFDTTWQPALYVGSNTNNVSSLVISENNTYINCGNRGSVNDDDDQSTEVITFWSDGNKSQNDYFSRDDRNSEGTPSPMIPSIKGHVYQPSVTNFATLSASNTPVTIMTLAKSEYSEQVNINYVADQGLVLRTGVVQVLVGATTATICDSFQFTGVADLGLRDIQFSASIDEVSNALSVTVLNPTGSVVTKLSYQYNQLY